jgi:serine/threonine protein kinase
MYDSKQKRLIHRLMEAIFNGEELNQFSEGYFAAVSARFTANMDNATKIESLIDYCARRGQLGRLVAGIQQAKPEAYEAFVQRVNEAGQFAPLALLNSHGLPFTPAGITSAEIVKNPEALLNRSLEDRYQFEEILDRGGVGAVFKAYDTKLEIDVAIKIIMLDRVKQPALRERVRQEVRTAIKLDHPCIVKIYDFGEADSMLYIIMEYIAGYNLREFRDYVNNFEKRIALPQILELVRQICLTVDYLHQQRVLHPGTKPENIMVKSGRANEGLAWHPVLINLGLMRPHRETLTAQQISVRRLTYSVSPELLVGHQTDIRSDVYALGIIMYNLVLGRPPFRPQNLIEATNLHVKEMPPAPRSIDPDIPEPVEAIILKALAKDPSERYLSAKGMAQAIGDYLTGMLLPASTGPSRLSIVTEPRPLVVAPGETVTTKIALHNEGNQEHYCHITVEGVPPQWLSLSPSAITLAAAEREEIELTIQPPRSAESRAGRHVLTIQAINQQAPEQVDEVKKVLTIAPYVQFKSSLWPEEIVAGQITQVTVENQGNSATTFVVQPKSDKELTFEPDRISLKLEAAESRTIDFEVKFSRRAWIGETIKQTFSILVGPADGQPLTHSGQITSRGVLAPRWVQAAIVLLGVLFCATVAIFPIAYPSDDDAQATADRATLIARSLQGTSDAATAQVAGNQTATVQAATQEATRAVEVAVQAATQTVAWQNADDDRDGLSNREEEAIGTDPRNNDTDGDGLFDGAEVNQFNTNPFNRDTDFDGRPDDEEIRLNLDPLSRDTDVDGTPDSIDEDPGRLPTSTPTITPNPTAQIPLVRFNNSTFTVDERQSTAIITVILDSASNDLVTVDYLSRDESAVAGNDYGRVSGTLVFNPNQTVQRFTVPIFDDNLDEADERISLSLENPQGANLGFDSEATVIILDEDADGDNGSDNNNSNDDNQDTDRPVQIRFSQRKPFFGPPVYRVQERLSPARIEVVLTEPATRSVAVDYATSDGTATAGSDYARTQGRLFFAAGEDRHTIEITIFNDSQDESDETVNITLSNAEGASIAVDQARLDILDDDP